MIVIQNDGQITSSATADRGNLIARQINIKGEIKTLDLFPETMTTCNMNLLWSNAIPKDKFAEQLDGSLGRIRETILSCLYGGKNV